MNRDYGFYKRKRRQTEGNGALLVVVNSKGSFWDYSIVEETVLNALDHYGMPYRVADLSYERLNAQIISDCAGIIIGQCRMGKILTKDEISLITEAVRKGTGLVNMDYDLRLYNKDYLDIFGFDDINPHPYASDIMRISNNKHYISEMQDHGEYHKFDRMVAAVAVEKWGRKTIPLAECILGREQLVYIRHITPWSAFEPKNYPVLFAGRKGSGKAIQFTISSRVWRNEFYGHARGMDDLLWRSILWVVKKPFAANMIPPFVTISFDDCSGRHDFKYMDISSEYGYIPLSSLFLRKVPERLLPKIADSLKNKKAEYNTHALDYYTHLYHKYGQGEYSIQQLKENFSYEDAWWYKTGETPAKTVRCHMGEMGVNALPFLKERGRFFLNPALQTGLLKSEMCMSDGYWPFNLQNFYYDYLPDDNDFFTYNSMLKRFHEDFLTGCTANLRESDYNDINKAASNLAYQLKHGIRGCFYAEAVTHEQKFEVLSLNEWERILCIADSLMKGFDRIFHGHDHIGTYIKGKDSVWIESADIHNGRISLKMNGKTQTDLMLSIFDDEGDSVIKAYEIIEAFSGDLQTEF